MTNVGQHEMTVRHPHFRSIYNNLPEDISFHDTSHNGPDNEAYPDYLADISKTAKELGASQDDINFFIEKIHPNCSKQQKSPLYFVPTHPYFGPEPHILNFEYWLTYYTYLLEHYIVNDIEIDMENIGWNKMAIAAMLQPSFKALCVHVHDTVNTFKFIAKDYPDIHHKFVYLPLASTESNELVEPKCIDKTLNVLFTNSYGGQHSGFIARGGNEVISAMAPLFNKYSNLHLRIIGPGPVFNHPQITQYPQHVTDDVYNSIIEQCHVFILPSMQLHSISLVKAMCNGIIPIVSDGWGFDEFVTHRYNGFIVEGQNGNTTRKDSNNILQLMSGSVSQEIVGNISSIIEQLLNNPSTVCAMSQNCLNYARQNFNIEQRNKVLGKIIRGNYG